jgi:ABC-type polysaccharide/polyol phosphate transport system ATPase subunit
VLFQRDVLENTEPVTADLADRPHMSLSRLRKEFPSEGDKVHVAVDNVSMTMYEGQIFALLGHNGTILLLRYCRNESGV